VTDESLKVLAELKAKLEPRRCQHRNSHRTGYSGLVIFYECLDCGQEWEKDVS